MSVGNADRIRFSLGVQVGLRVLIASYFLAVGVQLIPGVHFGAVFGSFLSPLAADAVAAGLVFLLTFSIMIGFATRYCALVLGALTIAASGLALAATSDAATLASMWSNIALVAGMMFLYGDCVSDRKLRRGLLQRKSTAPRRVDLSMAKTLNERPERPALPSDEELRHIFQTSDRPKAAPKPDTPKIEILSDYRELETERQADATFLRSSASSPPLILTNPVVENIFVADTHGSVLERAVKAPRRVVRQHA